MSADRLTLNPLYNDNRLKLGVFGANVSNVPLRLRPRPIAKMGVPTGR